mmetsp:Transcript_171673/g.550285  ORF Transcript_171673/g.550285 Transcript_171673/m.550285 type:complete len:329 (+) Transcript_171673:744-1730(+)
MLQHNHGQGTRLGAVLRSVATLEARVEGPSAANLHAHVQALREVEDGDELRDVGVPHRSQGPHDEKKAVNHLQIHHRLFAGLLFDDHHAVLLGARGRDHTSRLIDGAEKANAELAAEPEASHASTATVIQIVEHTWDIVEQTGAEIAPERKADGVRHAVPALDLRRAAAEAVLQLIEPRLSASHLRLYREGEREAHGHAPGQVVDDGLAQQFLDERPDKLLVQLGLVVRHGDEDHRRRDMDVPLEVAAGGGEGPLLGIDGDVRDGDDGRDRCELALAQPRRLPRLRVLDDRRPMLLEVLRRCDIRGAHEVHRSAEVVRRHACEHTVHN